MKLLIVGSCRNNDMESRVTSHQILVSNIGKELAKSGFELITGGAGGLQGFLAAGYKSFSGKRWTTYFAVGESKDSNAQPLSRIAPDVVIKTGLNFPMRDAYYLRKCNAVIALSGKLLTLSEIILAAMSYKKPVWQLAIGQNISIIRNSLELKDRVLITSNIRKGLLFIRS